MTDGHVHSKGHFFLSHAERAVIIIQADWDFNSYVALATSGIQGQLQMQQ
jgi:hypothetical protein